MGYDEAMERGEEEKVEEDREEDTNGDDKLIAGGTAVDTVGVASVTGNIFGVRSDFESIHVDIHCIYD